MAEVSSRYDAALRELATARAERHYRRKCRPNVERIERLGIGGRKKAEGYHS